SNRERRHGRPAGLASVRRGHPCAWSPAEPRRLRAARRLEPTDGRAHAHRPCRVQTRQRHPPSARLPSPYPAAAGPRPLSAARSSGQDHLDRPHDAEILIAAIGDDERAAAQQSLSGLLLNEGRRDAVDHAALQREVSAAAQPLAALWILETEHRPREFGNVDAIEVHLRMRRGGETGLAAGLLIGVENFALGHAGAHQLHHLAADELHRLEHLDMQRLWLAEHHDLIGVTAIVAIMAMRRHRADIAVLPPTIETEFGEERILRRFLAEIEL